ATALDNTITALAERDRQKKAVEVLAVWPDSKDESQDATKRLAARAADDNFFVRHGVVDALRQRQADPDLLDDAVAACALADIRARTCENNASQLGLNELSRLIQKGARTAISQHMPKDALFELQGHASASAACVDENVASHVLRDFAALMNAR
ncbi:MAG TPA: hypothetical protein VGO62_02110, partial [Myxococcota bacterium]